jgi:hypothetical protein
MQPKYLLHGVLELWIAGFGWVFTQRLVSCLLGFQKSFAISNSLRVFEKANHSLCQAQKCQRLSWQLSRSTLPASNKTTFKSNFFNVPARKTD